MWAEWMKDYDLRLTKEEIQEYKRKKGNLMNIKDKIMRLFGYENIENIKIPFDYMKTPPGKNKMERKRAFYKTTGKLLDLIVIKYEYWFEKWYLIDGYTSYLIAKENNIKYVKVVRV